MTYAITYKSLEKIDEERIWSIPFGSKRDALAHVEALKPNFINRFHFEVKSLDDLGVKYINGYYVKKDYGDN